MQCVCVTLKAFWDRFSRVLNYNRYLNVVDVVCPTRAGTLLLAMIKKCLFPIEKKTRVCCLYSSIHWNRSKHPARSKSYTTVYTVEKQQKQRQNEHHQAVRVALGDKKRAAAVAATRGQAKCSTERERENGSGGRRERICIGAGCLQSATWLRDRLHLYVYIQSYTRIWRNP